MKKEMLNQKFGMLTVVSEKGKGSNGEIKYLCACDCGGSTVVAGSNLRRLHTTSCGCVKKKSGAPTVIVSGAVKTRMDNAVSIKKIRVNKNIRRGEITPENDPKILELAENVKQVGVIEPIILNDSGDGLYDIVAGHRRHAASIIAEKTNIPAKIYEGLSPQQILEIQVSENLNRRDLLPTEEAEVYRRMRDELGTSIEEIALRIGKSQAHVYQYIKMLSLPEDVLQRIDDGEIGIAKAITLSVLPQHIIEKICHGAYAFLLNVPARDFYQRVKNNFMRDLSDDIGFKLDKEYEDEDGNKYPPCTTCPYKGQGELFGEFTKDDVCPNAECFRAKENIAYDVDLEERKERDRAACDDGGEWDGRGEGETDAQRAARGRTRGEMERGRPQA